MDRVQLSEVEWQILLVLQEHDGLYFYNDLVRAVQLRLFSQDVAREAINEAIYHLWRIDYISAPGVRWLPERPAEIDGVLDDPVYGMWLSLDLPGYWALYRRNKRLRGARMRKTILITGASSGLGAGMAREFAARGRDLALCARRVERLEQLKAELEQAHKVRVEVRALDVGDYEQVFAVFEEVAQAFGRLDRVIVNAGVGEGRRVGKGNFEINRRTIETNLVAGLAQCEAAVGIFRRQDAGHLVGISSMSAMRGLPKHLTAYAASKAGLAHLCEGIRAELLGTPIKVTTIFPGYIRTEMNEQATHLPFEVSAEVGSKALAAAIEREPATACVPWWPWAPMSLIMRLVPLRLVSKLA